MTVKRQTDELAIDDGFHEIQLSGKQLVFLFMATTLVSVVIFLFGVLVGRGVRGDTIAASVDAPITSEAAPASETAAAGGTPAAAPVASELSYYDRLGGNTPAGSETAKAAPPTPVTEQVAAEPPKAPAPVPAPPATTKPAPAPVQAAPTQPAAAAQPSSPLESAPGHTVQVMVLERPKAEALVKRLTEKGYPAYLTAQVPGSPMVRVRVGRYQDRREAEKISDRLTKEEQFKPWITR